jgi:ribonucleoside-diphosphate reductase alpha chain
MPPTGTLSIIAGASASIEPLFALAYRRTQVLGEQTLAEINPIFLTYLERQGLPVEQLTIEVIEEGAVAWHRWPSRSG